MFIGTKEGVFKISPISIPCHLFYLKYQKDFDASLLACPTALLVCIYKAIKNNDLLSFSAKGQNHNWLIQKKYM